MSREIKFRAWDKRYKEMYEVTCIDWEAEFVWIKYYDDDREEWFSREEHFADFELLQYTGLKDKNDVEIYEGTVIGKKGCPNFYVTFELGSYVAVSTDKIQALNWKHWKLNEMLNLEFMSIGNFYQNPELLEAKKHE